MSARGRERNPRSAHRYRVLLAIKTLGPGGAERLVTELVTSGDDGAFDFEVAYVLQSGDALVPEIRAKGVPIHSLGATSNLDLRWLRGFRRLLLEGDFDVVHFHLPYTAALGRPVVLSLPRARRPVTVYTEHSLWNRVSPLVKALNRATISRDRALIAVSDAAYAALPRTLQRRAQVVVHGVDLSASRSMAEQRETVRARVRAELAVPAVGLLAVTVANMRSEKGYDVLLETARLVAARGLPLWFAAAGEGSIEADLLETHRRLGLGDRLRFLGHRDDALELVTAADLVVLPSHQEGLPVVLMEATSVGATIVATEVGGVPQIVDDGVNGVLVPPGRPDAMADALERLVADPELRHRLGKQAMADGTRFDISRARGEIGATYRRILDAPL